jgi:hypothetical protein
MSKEQKTVIVCAFVFLPLKLCVRANTTKIMRAPLQSNAVTCEAAHFSVTAELRSGKEPGFSFFYARGTAVSQRRVLGWKQTDPQRKTQAC